MDLLIIGGGINGCGIARDAAGRGLSVTLCEMGDIASATSSWSSKLIHGGLRYLETYEFRLVRKALKEREVLMNAAPFLIKPLAFILPHEAHLRPPFLLRAGLFFYDHLAKRNRIPASKKILFKANSPSNPLSERFKFGYQYYDCQTDDARLTLLNALDAYEQGANILTHTKCTALDKNNGHFIATLHDTLADEKITVRAKSVINATGPWVCETNKNIAAIKTKGALQLVQGSHIIIPKLYDGDHAYILQNKDQRIVFAIPYCNDFTLIGTTDTPYKGDLKNISITDDETNYLCNTVNTYFKKLITPDSIIQSYSGVRALYDNHVQSASKTTRDYHLELNTDDAPYLCIFGGKLTTYRLLSEDALALLTPFFPKARPAWTKNAPLPGGDISMSMDDYNQQMHEQYPWLPPQQLKRYINAYGTHTQNLIGDADSLEALGQHFGADLYEHEVIYWIQNEWAQSIDDMLWRRSKLGLFLTEPQKQLLMGYIASIDDL